MGRLIVLCLIFLSVCLFPVNLCALQIEGAVWSTDALTYARDPSQPPPSSISPDATFKLDGEINFDSLRKNISFNEFLHFPTWVSTSSQFDPEKKMFSNNGGGNGDEGVFFSFTFSITVDGTSLPVTIIHDDGIYFSLVSGFTFSDTKQDLLPHTSKFDLTVPAPGIYTATLNYGAINDTDSHVLIFQTPEPSTLLVLGLALAGLAAIRRRM